MPFQKGHHFNKGKRPSKLAIENSVKTRIGKSLSEIHKKKISIGLNNAYKNGIKIKPEKGKHFALKTEFKKGQIPHNKGKKGYKNLGTFKEGKNHPNWINGLSRNGYSSEFSRELKLKIRTRDNFTCCK